MKAVCFFFAGVMFGTNNIGPGLFLLCLALISELQERRSDRGEG